MIGIDACDAVLVHQWANEGKLPQFRKLTEEAASLSVHGSCAVLQGSVWPTFFTSSNPAEHGMYYMVQMNNRTQRIRRVRAKDLKKPPFWSRSSGKISCVTVDIPKLGLQADETVQVTEWGALDHYSSFQTKPPILRKRILNQYGEHILTRNLREPESAASYKTLFSELLAGIAKKSRLNQELLTTQHPDLFISVFGETHAAGHYFWRFHDAPALQENPLPGQDPLLAVYQAVDNALGELISLCGDSANLFIFSGHGMMQDSYPRWILNDVLERAGMLRTRKFDGDIAHTTNVGADYIHPGKSPSSGLGAIFKSFANRHLVPNSIQTRLWMRNLQKDIDFAGTRAWALPTDLQGFIRLNLQGREPQGTVQRADYTRLSNEICELLWNLKDARSGEPVTENVYKIRELWPGGRHLDLLPDIAVLWKNSHVDAVTSDQLGEISVATRSNSRSGNHRPEGFCFAMGPDICTNVRELQVDLMDLGPTALTLLGESSGHLSGSPLPIVRRAHDQRYAERQI
jgi:predicted AlkP superfamily phosphohydrolase/phosphomutase